MPRRVLLYSQMFPAQFWPCNACCRHTKPAASYESCAQLKGLDEKRRSTNKSGQNPGFGSLSLHDVSLTDVVTATWNNVARCSTFCQ